MIKFKSLWLLNAICQLTTVALSCGRKSQQRVVLVSLDGFRWDYKNYTHYRMDNLQKMIANGVTVDYVRNVFPTVTYPNHQSMVTGLYPEHHGIIFNSMFDEADGTRFEPETVEERWWNQSEPVWITNQKQGFKSAVCLWPGSEVILNNTCPSFKINIETNLKATLKKIGFNERVDNAVSWMQRDEYVTFAAVYFEQPDATVHDFGADSNITKNRNRFISALSRLDMMLGHLDRKLNQSGLLNETNVIVIGKSFKRSFVGSNAALG